MAIFKNVWSMILKKKHEEINYAVTRRIHFGNAPFVDFAHCYHSAYFQNASKDHWHHGKKFPGLYTTRTYITVSTSVPHHHLSSPNIITYLSFYLHLMWVCGGLSTTRVTCPARPNINQTNTLMIFDQEYIYETPYGATAPPPLPSPVVQW